MVRIYYHNYAESASGTPKKMSESGITNPEKMSESGVEDPEKMSEYHTICNSRSYLSPSRSYLSVIPAEVLGGRGT